MKNYLCEFPGTIFCDPFPFLHLEIFLNCPRMCRVWVLSLSVNRSCIFTFWSYARRTVLCAGKLQAEWGKERGEAALVVQLLSCGRGHQRGLHSAGAWSPLLSSPLLLPVCSLSALWAFSPFCLWLMLGFSDSPISVFPFPFPTEHIHFLPLFFLVSPGSSQIHPYPVARSAFPEAWCFLPVLVNWFKLTHLLCPLLTTHPLLDFPLL